MNFPKFPLSIPSPGSNPRSRMAARKTPRTPQDSVLTLQSQSLHGNLFLPLVQIIEIPKTMEQAGFSPVCKELSHFLFEPNQRVEAAAPGFISSKMTWNFVFLIQLQILFIQLPGKNLGEKTSPW